MHLKGTNEASILTAYMVILFSKKSPKYYCHSRCYDSQYKNNYIYQEENLFY